MPIDRGVDNLLKYEIKADPKAEERKTKEIDQGLVDRL